MMPPRRAVFLDRDGVINRAVVRDGKPFPPESVEALEILPGVREALDRFREAGYLSIVVTNQPDIATGEQDVAIVDAIHAKLRAQLALDDIRMCSHVDEERCHCRKPSPGMILDAGRDFGIDLGRSFMVGDRWRDVEAGHRAGCTVFFIDYGYRERRPPPPYTTVNSLLEVAHIIAPIEFTTASA